jgi:DNA-binding transcriptional LysR family regulator
MKGPKVSLEQWQVLQAVVDQGGFAQAAAHLHRSQSSISYAVARLQERLGMPLLRLEGRRARLTGAGTALLRRSRHLVDEAIALERFADSLGQGWEPEVRLVVDAAFPTDLLMSALNRFQPLSQGSRVQLREVVLSGADEALEAGAADLVIGGQVPGRFLGEPLLDIGFVAVASAAHPLHRLGRTLRLADLERELQVVVRDSGSSRPRDVGWLGAEHRWSVGSIDTAVAAVSQGLGYAWLPEHQIRALLAQGVLAPLPLAEGGSYRTTLYLVFGECEHPGPATRQLAEILKQVAAGAWPGGAAAAGR